MHAVDHGRAGRGRPADDPGIRHAGSTESHAVAMTGDRSGADNSIGGKGQFKSFRHHLSMPWSPAGAPVLVVGDAMLDIYVFGLVERISPEAPVPVMRPRETRETAGGAANVAANIVGLGGS